MKNGDLIVQTNLTLMQFDDKGRATLQAGFKVYRGGAAVSLLLGTCPKQQVNQFDATAALNRLGWYGLKDEELDTVLVALRRWQMHLLDASQSPSAYDNPALNAIATDDNRHPLLTLEEIDELCERLNFGGGHAPA